MYYSEVVVAASCPARTLEDLAGGLWTYDDPLSLSGYLCMLRRVPVGFFGAILQAGSHLAALEAVLRGDADVAAVDSNVLALRLADDPTLGAGLRVIETLGPWPVQPVVVCSPLAGDRKAAVVAALLEAGERFSAYGIVGFAPATVDDVVGPWGDAPAPEPQED